MPMNAGGGLRAAQPETINGATFCRTANLGDLADGDLVKTFVFLSRAGARVGEGADILGGVDG